MKRSYIFQTLPIRDKRVASVLHYALENCERINPEDYPTESHFPVPTCLPINVTIRNGSIQASWIEFPRGSRGAISGLTSAI
jgi:hypothetical protein